MCDADFKTYTLYQYGEYHINEQAFNADKYFILETRNQYRKGFDIKSKVGEGISVDQIILPREINYKNLVDYFMEKNTDGEIDWDIYSTREEWISIIEDSYKYYKKVWKDLTYAKSMVENHNDIHELVRMEIKRKFSVGSSYTRSNVKEILKEIYSSYKIERIPKHYDLQDALTIKEKKINGERMVEILGKKRQ